jgi:NAD(P)-dependent dehydrogenase (short-subunit alcohol dehydrogenase family)
MRTVRASETCHRANSYGDAGGVVQFTRSLGHFSKRGIRVNALCPLFIETPLSRPGVGLIKRELDEAGGFIPMQTIIDGEITIFFSFQGVLSS